MLQNTKNNCLTFFKQAAPEIFLIQTSIECRKIGSEVVLLMLPGFNSDSSKGGRGCSHDCKTKAGTYFRHAKNNQ